MKVVLKTHVIPIQIMVQVNRRTITFRCLQIWGLNYSQIGYDHTRSNHQNIKGVPNQNIKGCLIHVFENICFVVLKHVWKYV